MYLHDRCDAGEVGRLQEEFTKRGVKVLALSSNDVSSHKGCVLYGHLYPLRCFVLPTYAGSQSLPIPAFHNRCLGPSLLEYAAGIDLDALVESMSRQISGLRQQVDFGH